MEPGQHHLLGRKKVAPERSQRGRSRRGRRAHQDEKRGLDKSRRTKERKPGRSLSRRRKKDKSPSRAKSESQASRSHRPPKLRPRSPSYPPPGQEDKRWEKTEISREVWQEEPWRENDHWEQWDGKDYQRSKRSKGRTRHYRWEDIKKFGPDPSRKSWRASIQEWRRGECRLEPDLQLVFAPSQQAKFKESGGLQQQVLFA